MEFLDKRVRVICDELKRLRIKQRVAVNDLCYKTGNFIHPADADADAQEWLPFDSRTIDVYKRQA